MNKQRGSGYGVLLFYAVLIFGGGFGWVWNIVKIIQADFVLSGLLVMRVIGVFVVPVGAVLGYF